VLLENTINLDPLCRFSNDVRYYGLRDHDDVHRYRYRYGFRYGLRYRLR